MKRLIAASVLLLSFALLGGCYYDPGYSYVRGGAAHGDAYYGRGSVRYDDGYYAPGYYGYTPGYYGGYGCCYPSGVAVGVGTTWYGGSHGREGYRRDRDSHHDRDRGRYGYPDGARKRVYDGRRQGDRAAHARSRSDNAPHGYIQRANSRERSGTTHSRPQPRSRDDSRERDKRHRGRYDQRD